MSDRLINLTNPIKNFFHSNRDDMPYIRDVVVLTC